MAHDPIYMSISRRSDSWRPPGSPDTEIDRARAKFNRLYRSFYESFEDLPRPLRDDAILVARIDHAIYYEHDPINSVGGALSHADLVMRAARDAVGRSRDPALRHSAPLARAARAYGELLRGAVLTKVAYERLEAMQRLGG